MRRLIHFCSEVDQAISTHILLTKTKSSLMTLGSEVPGTDQIGWVLFVYWLCWVFTCCTRAFFSCGYSLAVVHQPRTVVVSLLVKHRALICGTQA